MAHDLIICGGSVLDGTGAEATAVDVAVDGDRITAVGDLSDAEATREIDATGMTVTPGFVDLHTHFDAQVGWDPFMTSSSWHGVTTTLVGNCGMSFAPVDSGSEAYLAEMMESVEDIPRDAILDGIPWDWSTHPEYLDSVQRLEPALNVVGLVGHCAVRYQVMGERSLTDEEPTAERAGPDARHRGRVDRRRRGRATRPRGSWSTGSPTVARCPAPTPPTTSTWPWPTA